MKEIKMWYGNYPASPKDFDKWKAGTREILEKVASKLEK
jgi:hypothetical protein